MPLGLEALKPGLVGQIVKEIQEEDEIGRRAEMLKRHDIYRDGGERFLIEQLRREFDNTAINEMRLAPINLLKKIVNKRSSVYKKAPIRTTESQKDQDLVDHYTEKLKFNQMMMKANRYYNLFSNTGLYFIPREDGLALEVVPPYLYSLIPDSMNMSKVDLWAFNAFIEENRVFGPNQFQDAPTGTEGYDRDKTQAFQGDLVASGQFKPEDSRHYIFWSDDVHFTATNEGQIITNPEMGPEQFINPFGTAPVVNLTKERDNETWAQQGGDLVALSIALMSGWSDLLSISKEQGYSILSIISEEPPQNIKLGLNKAVWLRQKPDGPNPSLGYITASSPLAEYKDNLMDLLALMLSTNDMAVNEVGGQASAKSVTSGFQALIEMSSTLEAIEMDKPFLRDAEKEAWEVKIKAMHNTLFDMNLLDDESRRLGKFSEDFQIDIKYSDIKPLESEAEIQALVKERREMGMMTKFQAMKKLNPDSTDDQIQDMLDEIEEEKAANVEKMQTMMGPPQAENPDDESEESEEEESDPVSQ